MPLASTPRKFWITNQGERRSDTWIRDSNVTAKHATFSPNFWESRMEKEGAAVRIAEPAQRPLTQKSDLMKSCLALVGLITVGTFLFCGILGLMADPSRPPVAAPASSSEPPSASEKKPEKKSHKKDYEYGFGPPATPRLELTRETFDRCRTGMTYDEVVAIVGPPDSLMAENEIGNLRTVVYMWKGGIMANANMTFQNGKLVSKAQFGL